MVSVDPEVPNRQVLRSERSTEALLDAAEKEAAAHGALTMTLHVFANNARARGFYDRAGYDGELMRYIKILDQQA